MGLRTLFIAAFLVATLPPILLSSTGHRILRQATHAVDGMVEHAGCKLHNHEDEVMHIKMLRYGFGDGYELPQQLVFDPYSSVREYSSGLKIVTESRIYRAQKQYVGLDQQTITPGKQNDPLARFGEITIRRAYDPMIPVASTTTVTTETGAFMCDAIRQQLEFNIWSIPFRKIPKRNSMLL